MLLAEDKITKIYCLADDFCKFYSEKAKDNALEEPDGKRHRNKPNRLSDADLITILVAFHMGGHRCLKHFYLGFVCRHWTHLFPKTVSYSRFVELEHLRHRSFNNFIVNAVAAIAAYCFFPKKPSLS